MKHNRLLLLLCLCLACCTKLLASIDVRARQFTTTDGLPSNSVRCMFQDSKGFLWLGTLNGLCRYDGNAFVTFRPEPGRTSGVSLADNRIYKLEEDRNGFLWIGLLPELYSCYDLKMGRFVDYTGQRQLEQNYSALYFASNGDAWLWHKGNGVRQVKTDALRNMTSVEYRTSNGTLPHDGVLLVTEDNRRRIWIGTQKGLTLVRDGRASVIDHKHDFSFAYCHGEDVYFFSANGQTFAYRDPVGLEHIHSLPEKIGKLTLTDIIPLKDECILLTSKGTYVFHPRTGALLPDTRLPSTRGQVIRDEQGGFWVYGHTGEIHYIDPNTERIKRLRLIPAEQMQYIDHERYSVAHDQHGIIWISTYGNGLFAYNPLTDELDHFVAETEGGGVISSNFLLCVSKDTSGGIWAASEYTGLSHIQVTNKGVTFLYPESEELLDRSNTIRLLTRTKKGDILMGTRKGNLYVYDSVVHTRKSKTAFPTNVYAAQEDSRGEMWLGTRGNGMRIGGHWYDRNQADTNTLANRHIFSLYNDRKGRMWVGTFGGGLDLAIPTEDGTYAFRHFLQQSYGLRNVRMMLEDKNGMMWVGTSDGICIFHPDSLIAHPGQFHHFNHTNGKFCSNEIRFLFKDSKQRIWVGTSGAGLNLCEPSDDYSTLNYHNFTTADGLVNDVVQSILEDESGFLWVATEYGMSRFNPDNRSFENYFFSSSAQGNVYSENSACICADGRLLFGTNHGLTLLDPKQIPVRQNFSPVVLTNLYINGSWMTPDMDDSPLSQSIAYSDRIVLQYFQNSLRFSFSTLDYLNSGQTKYSYWLENYDEDWSEPAPLGLAVYKYLTPGTYKLHVRASNGAGIWNPHETVLKVVVRPPWWETGWAFTLYAVIALTLAIVTALVILNFNILRKRIDLEKELTEYKLVFFTNISHEFRTPLTMIQGALERMQRIDHIPQELRPSLNSVTKSTKRMLRLVNQLLEFRKMQNNKLALSLEETDIIAFLYEIFLSFGDVAEQKRMEYHFRPSIPTYKMYIDKSNIDKVVYNLLSNAFKYTPSGGRICLEAQVDEVKKTIAIRVSDTGIGIAKDKQQELFKRFMQSHFSRDSIGVGLHLSHELVAVHKGSISHRDNEGGGSVFTVTLPTDKGVYDKDDFLVSDSVLLKEDDEHAANLLEFNEETIVLPEPHPVPDVKRKLLIIEDDPEILNFLREEMSVYFEVETASDGSSGFEKACNYDADLIICDVLMPGLTGFEVTQKLKSEFATSHIPIILLTALNTQDKQLEGIEAGADAYIAKPFSVRLLLARAFQLIEQREKLREKYSSEPGLAQAAIPTATDRDQSFITAVTEVLEANLSRADFNVEEFAQLMKMGRTAFYKKLRGITGYSPNEYLRVVRMKKAAELLLSKEKFTVAEVSYKVGINDPFYFSKCFKTQFGITPSMYQKGK